MTQYIRLFSDWGGTKLERMREAGYDVVVLDEGAEKEISGADVREVLRSDGDWRFQPGSHGSSGRWIASRASPGNHAASGPRSRGAGASLTAAVSRGSSESHSGLVLASQRGHHLKRH